MEDVESVLRTHGVAPGCVGILWLEQSHIIFKTPWGLLIHVDPFLSRVVKPEMHVRPEAYLLPDRAPADYVFLTHDHRDHTDVHTLGSMARVSPVCRFFGTPESCGRVLSIGVDPIRIVELVAGETVELTGFTVTAVHSEDTADGDPTTHLGFVFDFGGPRVYHMGDTRKEPERYLGRMKAVRQLQPDVLIVPINSGHNNPGYGGAARLVEYVDPRLIIPCHYGCFTHNTADPRAFVHALPPPRRGAVRILEPGVFFTP
jgi:L-ascorbate 6-phosphate lactonase